MQQPIYTSIQQALGDTAKPVALKPFLIFLHNIFWQAETAFFRRKCQNPIANSPIQVQRNGLAFLESKFLISISGQRRICERKACV